MKDDLKFLFEKDVERFYREKFEEYDFDDPRSSGWHHDRNRMRYASMWGLIDRNVRSLLYLENNMLRQVNIHEFGVGNGYGLDFLTAVRPMHNIRYSCSDMIDVEDALIKRCERSGTSMPHYETCDVLDLSEEVLEQHDVFFGIGVFSMKKNASFEQYFHYLEKRVRFLLEHAAIGVAINGFHDNVDDRTNDKFYFEPEYIKRLVGSSSYELEIGTHASPYEFNLFIRS